jgi:hypothetical protein
MKTLKLKSNTTKATIIALAIAMFSSFVNAQKRNLSLSCNYRITGNGLGSTLIPQLVYRNGANELCLGTNIQKRNYNATGINLRYNRNLIKINSNELFVFLDVNYFNSAYLGKHSVQNETHVRPEYATFYQDVKFKVIGEHAGVGLKFIQSPYVNCFALIGIGSYQTLSSYAPELFRLREKCSTSLLLGLGMGITISKDHKKHN